MYAHGGKRSTGLGVVTLRQVGSDRGISDESSPRHRIFQDGISQAHVSGILDQLCQWVSEG